MYVHVQEKDTLVCGAVIISSQRQRERGILCNKRRRTDSRETEAEKNDDRINEPAMKASLIEHMQEGEFFLNCCRF